MEYGPNGPFPGQFLTRAFLECTFSNIYYGLPYFSHAIINIALSFLNYILFTLYLLFDRVTVVFLQNVLLSIICSFHFQQLFYDFFFPSSYQSFKVGSIVIVLVWHEMHEMKVETENKHLPFCTHLKPVHSPYSSDSDPTHSAPPRRGGGLLHVRRLRPRHVSSHDKMDHSLQWPSTVKMSKKIKASG